MTNYRIIDVNLNRLREALKICEDIIRFHYEDERFLRSLRKIRYRLLPLMKRIEPKVLPFRQSAIDLGRKQEFDRVARRDISEIFFANIKRAEEASRILEEFGKKPTATLPFGSFKAIRFALYDLEKEMARKYLKPLTFHLYTILDMETISQFFPKIPPLSELSFLLASCSDAIQFRNKKDSSTSEILKQAMAIKAGIKRAKRDVLFIINDRIDICLACSADGVHLGKKDLPWKLARKILPEKIIGATVRNLKDLNLAERSGCDYVGCGAVFPSPTKPSAKVIGIKRLARIVKQSSLPVVAIGGINLNNLPQVIKTGVAGVALVSAIFSGGEVEKNLLRVRKALKIGDDKKG